MDKYFDEMKKTREDISNVIAESGLLNLSECSREIIGELIYSAGYRKTFTSSLASDTQKAFKEGFIKGQDEAETFVKCAIDKGIKRTSDLVDLFIDFRRAKNGKV